ncbi:ABC transporter substrate-binding protein [Desulfosarcina ovata]|uniref:Peptide ABC transporter substrate-binding protein n=1 Tax=Desulfosarcina ovata subsp. ovata TaxID=2752305 RepID=A0A5K8ADC7_9BACT|nr:ABC transporter substrate-binding protein [Desulfosarcina ovata]BBO90625.1 peptide ABC transporter substrate-binding protein [Desulfosarcina ovata subsp. ovata]
MGRAIKGIIAAGLMVLLIVGPAMARKVLRIPNLEDPKTADCQRTPEFYMLPLNVFDRLVEAVTVGPGKSELVPGLAEKWEISADGKTYTFHLRKGVLFHNGEELTADDVVYTFDRMLDPATKALSTDILDFVDGAIDRLDGKADTVRGLTAIDRYTVRIRLKAAYAPFIAVMASPQASIFNRTFTTAAGDQFGLTPETTCGTGPFILKTYVLNDRQELIANDKYFRGRPKLDRIVVRVVPDPETMRLLFETDELDVFDCDYAITQIPYFYQSEKWKTQIKSGPRVAIYYFSMNQRIKPFDDVRVRKAFQMAIDREQILEKQFYGRGKIENAIIPRGLVCYSPGGKAIEYNPEKAKALLAEAGYANGVDMTILQVSSWSTKWEDINLIVQSMVKKAGFNVTIKQVDEAAYYATRKVGDAESYTQSWSADFNDPDNFLYTFFSQRGTLVRSLNNLDPTVFEGLDDARTMTDPAQRCALYRRLEERIIYEDAAWAPLFSLDHTYVVQPRVKNFVVPWNGWSDMCYFEMEVE